jgi:hypothetical protein
VQGIPKALLQIAPRLQLCVDGGCVLNVLLHLYDASHHANSVRPVCGVFRGYRLLEEACQGIYRVGQYTPPPHSECYKVTHST